MRLWGILITSLLLGGTTAAAAGDALEVGRPFPTLPLPALDDGSPMSIADFRGQRVVLQVFASW